MASLRFARVATILLAGLLLSPTSPLAQPADGGSSDAAVVLIPAGGAYLPGVDGLGDISSGVDSVLNGTEATLVLGGTLQLGSPDGPANVRFSGVKTTSSAVGSRGLDTGDAGRRDFLAVTGDLVLRPIPRFLLQPYVLGGGGARRLAPAGDSGSTSWEFVARVGAGLDVRIGTRGVLVSAEVVDYLSGLTGEGGTEHDAMALVGLGIPLF